MSKSTPWTSESLRKLGLDAFNKRLCAAQLEIILELVNGDKDVVACLPTGAGKTLTFWLPLLAAKEAGKKDPLAWVITPLNLLGKQNEEQLKAAGIRAISVTAKNATKATFAVREGIDRQMRK